MAEKRKDQTGYIYSRIRQKPERNLLSTVKTVNAIDILSVLALRELRKRVK